jgi:hypothetical protein
MVFLLSVKVYEKCRRNRRHFSWQINLFVLVFALLISDAAAGLASGLARGLALTAATLQGAFAEVLSFQSLNFNRIFLRVLE